MMILENKLESLKLLENKLESMKILENELESLKLQENQPGDGLVPLSIKKNYIRKCLREAVKDDSDSDTVASPSPRAENEPRGQNELSRKQKLSCWGDANKDVHFCPVCNTSRWKDSNTPGKKVPKKVLRYFPIIPRLQRLYKSSHTAKEMTWHATGKCTEPGYKACLTCNEDTPSVRVLGKTAYVGHRRFLKKPYKWRRSLEFNGETENGDPPREFSRDAIMTQLARLPTRVKGKHPRFGGVKIKHNVLVELNWTKRSIFYELEYWSFHTLKHNLDVMHIEKNVLESILNTLLMNDKSKDTANSKTNLKSWHSKWLVARQTKREDGFGSNFKHKVTDNDTNITGLKSHDCHIMMQRLLPYGLQQYLPPDVAKPLIELCLFFKKICSQTLMVDDMLKAQSKVIDILCNLELIYPPAFFDIMIHLVIHLPLRAIFGGPIAPVNFHNKDMKEEFPAGLRSRDPSTSRRQCPQVLNESSELYALACGQSQTPISVQLLRSQRCEDDDIIDEEDPIPHDLADS
ncbi:zinc finger, PHD-type containing protein [Tanacetum coccineum]